VEKLTAIDERWSPLRIAFQSLFETNAALIWYLGARSHIEHFLFVDCAIEHVLAVDLATVHVPIMEY
jgi:hypothetical protein